MSSFQQLHQPIGRIIRHAGKAYHFFGGTAYLGLSTNEEYIELYKEGIDRYGLNNGTSRSNNVQQGIYQDAESNMAFRFGFEKALLLSSGYLAAQLAVRQMRTLAEVLYAPGTHPALWLENRVPLPQVDFATWARQCIAYINDATQNTFVVVANTFDNLTPCKYDFSVFKNVHPTKKIYLLLDDSHGIGIAKANGCYITQEDFGTPSIELVIVASLAKGMGTDAGIILCSDDMARLFSKSPFFRGASPTSPAALYALVHGERLYKNAVTTLHRNRMYLDARLNEEIQRLSDFPVFTIGRQTAFQELLENGILISSFAYPLPEDPLINRIVISAYHRQDDLDLLIENLADSN